MIDRISGIIWDWNGTLLNDINLCVHTMNKLLSKRELTLLSEASYKEVFSFPVKEYYQKIGFNFLTEPFETPALEFIESYNSEVKNCALHQDAFQVLTYFQSIGFRQFVLSAMEQTVLEECLRNSQIDQFFEHISGLDNHYAESKIENGHRLISELNLKAEELVLIGDTVHDFEVANELGCQCVLIANGHQSKKVLQKTGVLVIDHIGQLLK